MKKRKLISTTILASMALLTGCNKACEHIDDNKDHNCDTCGEKISECVDENKDHNCDVCGAKLSEHIDENKDHNCDTCGQKVSDHADANNDHNCDYCGVKLSEHIDESKDHNCDICGQKMSEHVDANKDHNCDVCNAKISEHVDANKDHNCDSCGQKMSEHADANNDHNCDYCGAKVSDHADANNDHNCDVCGTKVSEHADANNDHNCDLCGEPVTQHVDENKDHNCDICSEKISEHVDEDKDHVCDYCEAALPWVELTVEGVSEAMNLYAESYEVTITLTTHNDAADGYTVAISDETVATFNASNNAIELLKEGTFTFTVTSNFDANVKYEQTVTVIDAGFCPSLLNNGYTYTRSWPEEVLKNFIGEGDYDLYVANEAYSMNGFYYKVNPKKGNTPSYVSVVFPYNYSSNNANAIYSDIFNTLPLTLDYYNQQYIAIDDTYTYTVYPSSVKVTTTTSLLSVQFYLTDDLYGGSTELTTNTDWTDAEKQKFDKVFPGIEVPFFKLGADYAVMPGNGFVTLVDYSPNFDIITDLEEDLVTVYGWTYDKETYSYSIESGDYLITIGFESFVEGYGSFIQFEAEKLPLKVFPEDMLDETIGDASDCEVPIPEGTGFEVETGVEDGQVKYMDVTVYGGSFEDYIASFDDSEWYITQDDEVYYTITSLDYAVQIEVIGGSEDGSYMIFVMVGLPADYLEWPSDAVATFLNNRTTEVVPAANGTGYYTQVTNEGTVLEITVVGGNKVEYLAALVEQGWLDKGSEQFLSPNESINVTVGDAYGENQFVVYVVFAGNEVSRTFPADEVTAVLGEVAQDTIFGPEGSKFTSEVIENTQNAIFVKAYCTADNYADYIAALEEASWTVTEDLYGFTAVSPTKTVTIYATDYTDYPTPYITLEFIAKEVAQGNAEFPAEAIASYIGEGKEYPIPEGDSYAGEDYGGYEYDVTIAGGDREAYIATLLEAGFTYDADMSYEPEYAAYKSVDGSFYVYVYGSESNTDYVVGFGEAFTF